MVGDLINFRGIVYAPLNEQGVVFLFGKVIEDLNMYIELIRTGYPDCIGRRFVGKGWEKVYIEFEYNSKAFEDHGHDPKKCDIIVCWEHDWENCPLEVIELKEIIKDLPARPIKRPTEEEEEEELTLEEHFEMRGASQETKKWFKMLEKNIRSIDDSIWRKIAKWSVTFYSPERVFAYVKTQKSSIKIHCFTGSDTIEGVENPFDNAPKWGRCYMKNEEDLDKVTRILNESYKRVCEALKNNENTGWFAKIEEEEQEEELPF
jgi:hypothetical protein